MEIDDYRSFFFDLDKTLWNWDEKIIGAEDTIISLKGAGKKVYFHTDNTLLTREGYAKKLTSMGIEADKEHVITSGYAVAKHLEEKDVTKVYAIGETGLIDELQEHDINVTKDADIVVVGFDRQFSYSKLKRAHQILKDQGDLYLCSTEDTFRTSINGQPHQGPLNQAFKKFGEPKVAGKPGEIFRRQFENYFSYFNNRSLFVGDRLADIETGNRLGMKTAAVMSGDINKEKLENAENMQIPDYGISHLAKLKRRVL